MMNAAVDSGPSLDEDRQLEDGERELSRASAGAGEVPKMETPEAAPFPDSPNINLQDGGDSNIQLSPVTTKPTATERGSAGGGGGGLSELSKQLRALQAKNQSQSIEIDRLERQLRILAELQGVSVGGLRNALEQACEGEAHFELQQRVASLQAQLEAASLTNQPATDGHQAGAFAKKIANLELRVGELEEVEEKQRAEIQGLYGQLVEQKTQATRLQMLCEQQRNENDQLKMDLSERSVNSQQKVMAAEQQALSTRAREAETELQVLREKLSLAEQQHASAVDQSSLRNAQFKARSLVQEESIRDLEQQLSSLYVAFDLLREEQSREDDTRMRLQTYLHQADSEVARQVSDRDQRNRGEAAVIPQSPLRPTTGQQSLKSPKSSPIYTTPPPEEPILSGELLIRSSNVLKKWKKRSAFLYSTLTHHRLDIRGETRGYNLHFGVSRVDKFHKQPFAFVIHVDPRVPDAPTIYAAATNEGEYTLWMNALTAATVGDEVHELSNSSESNDL